MSEVTRNTGFARGLFDAVESDSGKVKDKESKVAWLTKIIACVGLALGEHVRARPQKIVAGLEPEHTNAFLQQLARAASAGDAADAVRRTLAGETFVAGESKPAPPRETPEPPRPRDPSPPPREPSPPRARSPSPEAAFAPPPPPHSDSDDEPPIKPVKDQSRSTNRDRSPPAASRRPPPGSNRPQSARRAPPKIVSNVVEVDPGGTSSRDGSRPGSVEGSRPAPTAASSSSSRRDKSQPPLANVLGEGDVADSDDDDESGDDASAPDGSANAARAANPWDRASMGEGGGALVRDMLAAKREGDAAAASAVGATTDEATAKAASGGGKGIILGSRRRSRKAAGGGGGGADDHPTGGSTGGVGGGVSAAMFRDDDDDAAGGTTEDDVEAIRERVQALVQFTNPLGKAMDALQEDVETMRRELTFWQRERENMGRIAREVKSAPLGETVAKQDRRLEEADEEIAAMKKKIQSVKAAIHRNDDKIAKLLDMVVTPA